MCKLLPSQHTVSLCIVWFYWVKKLIKNGIQQVNIQYSDIYNFNSNQAQNKQGFQID